MGEVCENCGNDDFAFEAELLDGTTVTWCFDCVINHDEEHDAEG